MSRFQVSVPYDASVTLEKVWEIEAATAEEAKRLIDSDEALELDDDEFILVDDSTILDISNCEMQPDAIERMQVVKIS